MDLSGTVEPLAIPGAVVLQIRGFANEQVTRFVRSWYAAAAQQVSTEDGPDAS